MDHHRRATELFLACCEIDSAERASFLAGECGEDRELIAQVEGMLAVEEQRPEFLATSAVEDAAASAFDGLPASIGPFRIVRKLGEGGMGAVYEAEQERPQRTVALKVLQPLFLSPEALRRFEHEGEFLARLQHPGIAQIFDSGRAETEHGSQPYFALELVRGEPLTEYARESQLSVRDRLELLALVADAVQHAHQHGVIHRDLKPANILVEESGQPKVLDFGIARASDADVRLATQQTDVGQILGTLAYMSPEQASGDPGTIDTRSDVYSLGVLLYELLADRLPYDVSNKSLPEAVRIIQEQAPSRLSTISTHRGDVETIVRTALDKDKERRYASAAALATDIRHYLKSEPIAARPPSRVYTLTKLVQRNKALAGSMALGVLALVTGLIASLILGGQASASAAREKQRLDEVLRLSAYQRLEDLEREAERLWPPHPENLPAYDDWMDRARELLRGLEPNPADNDIGHRARLALLDERALPYSDEQREADRLSHPRFKELQGLRVACAAFERARAVRAGEAEPDVVVLDESSLPSSAAELIELALPLVDIQRTSFGDEARGLALALLARDRVEDAETDTLASTTYAQALFAVGKPVEAIEQMRIAESIAPPSMRQDTEVMRLRVERWYAAGHGPGGEVETPALLAELAAVEAEVAHYREWRFDSSEDHWWFQRLRQLVGGLEALESGLAAENAIVGSHGWSVGRRRTVAAGLEQGFAVGGAHARRWDEAVPLIHEFYGGLELSVQMGVVPIGPDPDSGLWEFWHVASGAEPMRDSTGKLVMTAESGLVFVLLPGGTFTMGAQSKDPAGPNFNPAAHPELDGPLHDELLPPFFMSKYEMTQGQWEGLTGQIPCYYTPGSNLGGVVTSRLHPVETVSWSDCWLVLGRLGLGIPTEAQWEYGARAGSPDMWSTGKDPRLLNGAANLLDEFAMAKGGALGGWGPAPMPWSDGYVAHAPVGMFAPNGFGLHDVHGNVWEWCLDPYAGDRRHADFRYRELDPLAPVEGGPLRPYRGGGFMHLAQLARVTGHSVNPPVEAIQFVGVRPMRAVLP